MFGTRSKFLGFLLVAGSVAVGNGQGLVTGAERTRLALEKLGVLGSVLMIGAHPDDERTDTLAYFARGRLMRTAYLSVTRGEGGQNLIGPEQGDLLGVIRTQELLAARRLDGAEQFFTRAIDFGYSKSAEETLGKWGRERILGDIVWVVRRFRPDVIVLCFSGTPRDGHGQHQASGILGKEAFTAAADPKRFPEQLQLVEPWQAKRLVWNVYGQSELPGQVKIDTGDYNPRLGYSYAEIASLSRSMHRSQGMGVPLRRGSVTSTFVPLEGEPATKDPFDGIDTSWDRVPGGEAVGPLVEKAVEMFEPAHPEETIDKLFEARALINRIREPWARWKRAELDEAIAQCAGLWLDAAADRWAAVPGSSVPVKLTALVRSHFPLLVAEVWFEGAREAGSAPHRQLIKLSEYNHPETKDLTYEAPPQHPYSQPYWLARPHGPDYYDLPGYADTARNEPVARAHFLLRFGDTRDRTDEIELIRPVEYRYVDRTQGELTRPLEIVPPVAVDVPASAVVFPNAAAKRVEVTLRANVEGEAGRVALQLPEGWRAEPAGRDFKLGATGDEAAVSFEVTPPAAPATGRVRAVATVDGKEIASGTRVISYPHFPVQVVFPAAEIEAVRVEARVLAKRIGYVMGAGDEVPDALRQLGCEVTLLGSEDLAGGELGRFDAIVTGVRAYNVRVDLRANQARLLEYVRLGGTLVVQYNVLDWRSRPEELAAIGPYPMHVGHDRVSVEESPVGFPDPKSPLLAAPNAISEADFAGWVQERGLYFASDWDPRYRTLLESHDPGEGPHPGGTLYAKYGAGAYVFTAYSWFRELPAGVPGAYRVFANLLSAGKVLK